MEFTSSLKKNYEFRRVYSKGKSSAQPCLVVYARKNRSPENRLGITVSNKIGGAVTRNRIRRRLREAYRLSEALFVCGFDIVIVARHKSVSADYNRLRSEMIKASSALGIVLESKSIEKNSALSD
ncbi:MAG: ribonuclease P protein component [Ruminococcaceae bacterium]|nr:ribonuclease P protein component [Oscillospiraceae bacterium]